MRIVYAAAALLALVGMAQIYEKGTFNSRRVPLQELRYDKSLPLQAAPAQYSERPTPRAKLYKLLWIPTFDYREFTDRVIRT